MRLAVVDVGTNTAQLLIVDVDGTSIHRRHAAERFVRLGEGVDERGHISDAAVERLCETLREYVATARGHDVDQLIVAGTSALRDAANREAVVATVEERLSVSMEVLSGLEEATWSFAAACAPFKDLTGPCLVLDIGGGSTELVAGQNPTGPAPHYPEAITERASLDVGCVRLTERCFSTLPPSEGEVATVDRLVQTALDDTGLDLFPRTTLIGTAGTATALALVHAGPESSWDALHGEGFVLSSEEVRRWRERLLQLSVEEIRALHPDAMRGRADVFPVGVLLLERVSRHYELDALRVSPYELRHGLALRALAQMRTS